MALSRRGFAVPRSRFHFDGAAEWVRRLHSPRLGVIDASPSVVADRQAARTRQAAQSRQQQVIDRLLVAELDRPFAPYESLPSLFEAPDLVTNPRLAPLVTAIDSRLLAPLYCDIDRHNGRLKFFLTGHEHKPASSFYVRSFLPHFHQNNLFYLNRDGLERKDMDGLPWQPLATLMTDVFASIGVTELRDFYTHVLPAGVGRHAPHRDRLQSGTWKVDIRWSPNWTELLFLDAEDARWYALRFPPGGSGFVIDSTLFRCFHGVRAGPAIQQSVLLVFNRQGSTMQMVREAFAARANALPVPMPVPVPHGVPSLTNVGAAAMADATADAGATTAGLPERNGGGDGAISVSLAAFAFPVTTAKHPRSVEALRVAKQSAVNLRNSVRRLRAAVLAIEPTARRAWMQVPPSVIGQAIATFPEAERTDLLQIFHRCKIHQRVAFGNTYRQGKRARRLSSIDDRHVSIQGSASVEGKTYHFPAYNGTEATRLRLVWERHGKWYRGNVNMRSSDELSASLAALMAYRKIRPTSGVSYGFLLEIDGDSIVGVLAAWLRELGLTLQVVHLEGELDNHTKRVRELDRATRPVRRTRSLTRLPARGSWSIFLAERFKIALKRFPELTPEDKKVYEDQAAADKARYQAEMSKLGQKMPKALNAFSIFMKDHPGTSLRKAALAWAQLSPQEKRNYQAKRSADLLRYRTEQQQLTGEGRVKMPRTAFNYFMKNEMAEAKPMYDHLRPVERKVYEDKAREGRQRYDELAAAANQQAPTTSFEVFRTETSPALQSDSSMFSDRGA